MNQNLINKKNILIFLGVIIFFEILWAGWTFLNANQNGQDVQNVQVVQPQITQIELEANKTQVKAGEKFTVSINIISDKATDGVDLIINYDPKLLSVEKGKETNLPVITGSLYSDYPENSLDEKLGKIAVSGVSAGMEGTKPNGIFGSIIFTAKASGEALISLEFEKDSTSDTNVVEKGTSKDILEMVKNVSISISP